MYFEKLKRSIAIMMLCVMSLTLQGCIKDDQGQQTNGSPVTTAAPTQRVTCDKHTDADDDGTCDVCGESVLVVLDLYVINDLHGKFDDSSTQPGVDELSMYLRERMMTDDHPIFLSSGDMWQGSAESNQTKGGIIIDWMNELGFVSMTLGNHEFDWGEDTLTVNAEQADFPFLAINVYDRETKELESFCQPSVMLEVEGIQVGIIGAIGDCYSSISAEQSDGFYIIAGRELTQLVKDEAVRLRNEGADIIIYSLHDGYDGSVSTVKMLSDSKFASFYDTELSNGYVDLVFEGHTHQAYVVTDKYGVYHLQDGGDNRGISHVTLSYNTVTEHDNVDEAEFVSSSIYSQRGSDPLRDELLEKYSDVLARTREVLGVTRDYVGRDELRRIVAQMYYEQGEELWGDKYDIVLGGGFLSVRSPGSLEPGEIRYSQLQMLFPFDNSIVLCSVSGADLKRVFFNNSNSNYFIYCGEYGESVRDHIDPTATYYVITDSYSSTYAPNRLTELERFEAEYYARDLLAEYIADGRL